MAKWLTGVYFRYGIGSRTLMEKAEVELLTAKDVLHINEILNVHTNQSTSQSPGFISKIDTKGLF